MTPREKILSVTIQKIRNKANEVGHPEEMDYEWLKYILQIIINGTKQADEIEDERLIIDGEVFRVWCYSCDREGTFSLNYDDHQIGMKTICQGNAGHDTRLME